MAYLSLALAFLGLLAFLSFRAWLGSERDTRAHAAEVAKLRADLDASVELARSSYEGIARRVGHLELGMKGRGAPRFEDPARG